MSTLRIASCLVCAVLACPNIAQAEDRLWVTKQRELPQARHIILEFSHKFAKARLRFQLLPSKSAVSSHTRQPAKSRPGKVTAADPSPIDPAELAREKAYGDYINAQLKIVAQSESRGRWKEARERVLPLLDANPGFPTLAISLADIDFQLGNYSEAYDALLPVSTPDQSEWVLLRLSVASAHIGIVVPGQEQYVLSLIDNTPFGDGMLSEYRKYFALEGSPKEIAMISHLACVTFESFTAVNFQYHMQQALALDPKNVVSNYFFAMGHRSRRGDPHYDYALSKVQVGGKMWKRLDPKPVGPEIIHMYPRTHHP